MNVFGRSSLWLVPSLIFGLLTASCTASKTRSRAGEETVSSTSSSRQSSETKSAGLAEAAPSCGHEVQVHGQGINDAARDCLWDAYQAGREAGLALTLHTVEGDRITFTLHVHSKTSIDVVEDNRDHWGSPGVRRSTCSGLARAAESDGHRGFLLQGCEGTVKTFGLR